jgi:ribokinase
MEDVITIGSATRDVFLRSRDIIALRSARFQTGMGECIPLGSKIEIDEIRFTVGGSAANAAVTFARRGFRTAVVAKVGRDIRGEEIIRTLAGEGIQTRRIVKDPHRMSPYSVVILTPSGERSILVYRGAAESLKPSEVSLKRLRAKWFYVTHLGGASAALFPKILRHAQAIGAKVAVNPGKTQLRMPIARLKPLLNLIDVFIVNREEGSYLTKVPYERESAIFEKLDLWVRGLVVMTDGPAGVTVSDGRTRWRAGTLKERRRVDRTGAGDAFGSGFVAGLIEREGDIPYAIQLGSANATSKLEHIGAQEGLLRKGESIFQWGKLKITTETLP